MLINTPDATFASLIVLFVILVLLFYASMTFLLLFSQYNLKFSAVELSDSCLLFKIIRFSQYFDFVSYS